MPQLRSITGGREGVETRPSGEPALWAPVRTAVGLPFTALAHLRGGRAFHPLGASYSARIEPVEETLLPFAAHAHEALVRLSKAAGLPPRFPDVYGLALRVPHVYGRDAHQDVLLATTGQAPLARHVLSPALGFDRRRYSSLLLYRLDGRRVLLGARYAGAPRRDPLQLDRLDGAVQAGEVRFELSVASPRGPWKPAGELRLQRRLTPAASEALRFHPWNTSRRLRPAGLLNALRGPAYEASQLGATSE